MRAGRVIRSRRCLPSKASAGKPSQFAKVALTLVMRPSDASERSPKGAVSSSSKPGDPVSDIGADRSDYLRGRAQVRTVASCLQHHQLATGDVGLDILADLEWGD